MAKQSQMYFQGNQPIGLREYLKRGEKRARRIKQLIKDGKTNVEIADIVRVTPERIRQIRNSL